MEFAICLYLASFALLSLLDELTNMILIAVKYVKYECLCKLQRQMEEILASLRLKNEIGEKQDSLRGLG